MSQNNQQLEQTARLAGLVGQIGCVTGLISVGIIALAFFAGQFLDSRFETDGIITVLLLIGSFPITLFAIVRISLWVMTRSQTPAPRQSASTDEDENRTKEESAT